MECRKCDLLKCGAVQNAPMDPETKAVEYVQGLIIAISETDVLESIADKSAALCNLLVKMYGRPSAFIIAASVRGVLGRKLIEEMKQNPGNCTVDVKELPIQIVLPKN